MKANEIDTKLIKVINNTVNLTVLTIIVLLISYAGYALWDSNHIHHAADKSHYEKYKPAATDEGKSFKELQALNPEVFAWLDVYGTNIDYPIAQGPDNMKYVDTNAEGNYSLSGSIFLDCNNSKHFDDFNSIVYGHNMAKNKMFGDIGTFKDKEIFDSHRYGNLYFDGKDNGIEFFAFIHTSAYDDSLFTAGIKENDRQRYLNNVFAEAIHVRDIGVTTEDRIILLSTCSSDTTNGRNILVGRITDEIFEDPFLKQQINEGNGLISGLVKGINTLNLILLTLLIVLISVIIYKRKKKNKRSRNYERHTEDKKYDDAMLDRGFNDSDHRDAGAHDRFRGR